MSIIDKLPIVCDILIYEMIHRFKYTNPINYALIRIIMKYCRDNVKKM